MQGKDCFALASFGFHPLDSINVHFCIIDDEILPAFLFYLVHISVLGSHRFRDHLPDYFLHGAATPGTDMKRGACTASIVASPY
jgi:hypothetical protein